MITRTKSQVRERWPYLLFLGLLLILLAYTYSLTSQFRVRETGVLPRLVIFGMTVVILLDLVSSLFPQIFPEQLQSKTSEMSGFENRNIHLIDIAKQFFSVILYLAGMYYIGFFTATFAFAGLYAFFNGPESSLKQRAVIGAAWATGINIFLYVLFVELLQVGSVFQFGFLP
jgi:hypothetical protein